MSTLILVAVILLTIVGILGAILPALPGPPLNFLALLLTKFVIPDGLTWHCVGLFALLTGVVIVVDYIAPVWITKLGGGSKSAVTGSIVGTVAGLFFFAPWGLLIGPFLGAFIGELIADASIGKSLRIAMLSFVAFLLTTGLKLALCCVMSYYTFAAWIALVA